jgi:hypothetical protein
MDTYQNDTIERDYSRYLKLQPKELIRLLEKQRDTMQPALIEHIINEVARMKKELRSATAKARVIKSTWHEVMRPLRSELRIVVNMGRYKSKSYNVPERSKAITAYRAVLEKAVRLLTKYQVGDYTPTQLAKIKNVPNGGEHWVDWIPMTVKETVENLFNEIPHHFRAKSKVPFERRTMDDKRDVLLRRLATSIKQELGRAYKDLANDPDEFDNVDHHEYIARMELAQKAIIALPDDAHVPATWQGLFKQQQN